MNERKTLRRILAAVGLIGMLVIVSAFVLFVATRPSLRVMWQDCQPETVTYANGTFCVSVIEGSTDWRGFPLYTPHSYNIVVAQGTQTSYGHLLDYRFTNGVEDIEAYIQRSSTEWTPDGVSFIEADGHRLFVPASMLSGGR